MNDIMINGYIKLTQAKETIQKFVTSEKGVTAIEYAVVVAGVAAVVMVIFGSDGPVKEMLDTTFSSLKDRIETTLTDPNTP